MLQENLFLLDTEFIKYCEEVGTPFPFSLSFIRKDRMPSKNKIKSIGIPVRHIGGTYLYNPIQVFSWIAAHPVLQSAQLHDIHNKGGHCILKRGKPLKSETVAAKRLGISVPELRALSQ